MQHFNGTAVSGIGDAAFLAKPNSIVEFIKGSIVVALQPQGALVDQTDVAKLEMLARAAAAHI